MSSNSQNLSARRMSIATMLAGDPPEMDFALPGLAMGTVGLLVAPGSMGKSWWALQAAMHIAAEGTLTNLLGLADVKGGSVAILSAEDPQTAVWHRIHAIRKKIDIPQDARNKIEKNLFIYELFSLGVDLIDDVWTDGVIRELKSCPALRLVIVDTARRVHTGDENDNGAMAKFVNKLEMIAEATKAAVLVIHHTNKASKRDQEGNATVAARGASAFVDNARFVAAIEEGSPSGVPTGRPTLPQGSRPLRYQVAKCSYSRRPDDIHLIQGEDGVLTCTSLLDANPVVRAVSQPANINTPENLSRKERQRRVGPPVKKAERLRAKLDPGFGAVFSLFAGTPKQRPLSGKPAFREQSKPFAGVMYHVRYPEHVGIGHETLLLAILAHDKVVAKPYSDGCGLERVEGTARERTIAEIEITEAELLAYCSLREATLNAKNLRQRLRDLCAITLTLSNAKAASGSAGLPDESASSALIGFRERDDAPNTFDICVCWRLAEAFVDEGMFSYIDLEERHSLATDTARTIHCYLSSLIWAKPGEAGAQQPISFELSTLIARSFRDSAAEGSTLRMRKKAVRDALEDIGNLKLWNVEITGEKASVTRSWFS